MPGYALKKINFTIAIAIVGRVCELSLSGKKELGVASQSSGALMAAEEI